MGKMLTNYNNLSTNKEKEKYDASMKQLMIILTVGVAFYYILPIIFMLMFGNKTHSLYIYLMFDINPVFVFGACFLHGKNHGFKWFTPVATGLMFIPTVFVFGYDLRFASMGIFYMVIGVFGTLTGYLMLRRKLKRKAPIGLNGNPNKYASKKKKK